MTSTIINRNDMRGERSRVRKFFAARFRDCDKILNKWAKNHPNDSLPSSAVQKGMKEILKIMHDWVEEEHWIAVGGNPSIVKKSKDPEVTLPEAEQNEITSTIETTQKTPQVVPPEHLKTKQVAPPIGSPMKVPRHFNIPPPTLLFPLQSQMEMCHQIAPPFPPPPFPPPQYILRPLETQIQKPSNYMDHFQTNVLSLPLTDISSMYPPTIPPVCPATNNTPPLPIRPKRLKIYPVSTPYPNLVIYPKK